MTYPAPPPPPDPMNQEAAGLMRAGKVAIWVWILAAVVPIVLVLACCGFCGLGSVVGIVNTPVPTPTP